MAFADDGDVGDALGRSLTSSENLLVDNLLEQASDLVAGYLGYTPDPVPAAVTRVVATMVVAVFTKPSVTVADYDASGYSTTREAAGVRVGVESATTEGPWLTNALKMRLRPYRDAVVSLRMESEQA